VVLFSARTGEITIREQIPLFCIVSAPTGRKPGVPGETMIDMIEKGLIADHPPNRPALMMRGRAALKTDTAGAATAIN
jgi:hypothetical protein